MPDSTAVLRLAAHLHSEVTRIKDVVQPVVAFLVLHEVGAGLLRQLAHFREVSFEVLLGDCLSYSATMLGAWHGIRRGARYAG
jgi:hypothetical protein